MARPSVCGRLGEGPGDDNNNDKKKTKKKHNDDNNNTIQYMNY